MIERTNQHYTRLSCNALFIESIMDEVLIFQLRQLLNRGRKIAWVQDGEFHEIREIVFAGDEERAIFADGSEKYVDLYNASPYCFILFEDAFSIR